MKPNEKDNIFTDDVDYSNTPDSSVWGMEDKTTADLLAKTDISGKWLNLCAGDGRFNNQLLAKADHVLAVDIDERPLQKLLRITPSELKHKLVTKTMNVVKPFTFRDREFDGIFCVGTMHLFPKPVFQKISLEMKRVLKTGGRVIMDFATDIKRTYPDGSLWIVENEPNYTLEEAINFLQEIFQDCQTTIHSEKVAPEKVTLADKEYIFTSNLIILEAVKNE